MATVYSDIGTLLNATDPSSNVVDSNALGGKVRVVAFSYDTGSTGPSTGDVVRLTKLPAGARVLGIYVVHDAMTSSSGTAGANIGDATDPDRYAAAYDFDSASTGKFIALRHEDTDIADKTLGIFFKQTPALADPGWLTLVITGEDWAASKRLSGYVLYSVE
jgi:hypothetical protein